MNKFNEVYAKIIMEMNQSNKKSKSVIKESNFEGGVDNAFAGTFKGSFEGFFNSLSNRNKRLFQNVIRKMIHEINKNAQMDPDESEFQEKDIESSIEFARFLESVLKDESSYSNFINELKEIAEEYWPNREDYFNDVKMFLWDILSAYAERKFNVGTLAADF